MIASDLLTKEDLKEFKAELLSDLKSLMQTSGIESKKWFKSADVRRILNISPGTLQNLRVNRSLRFTKVGGTMYYKAEDINRMLGEGQPERGTL